MKPFKYCPHCGEKLIEDSNNEKEMEELDKQFKEKMEKMWRDTKGSEYK